MRTSSAVTAIAKLVGAQRHRANISACAEAIARSYEAAGDATAAAAIRKALDVPQLMPRIPVKAGLLEWCPAEDLSSTLVLDVTMASSLERLVAELQQAHRLAAAGIDAPTRIIFSGPSGTGKTLAARWLGGRLGIPVAILRITAAIDGYLGATGANLAKAFDEVHGAPAILFLDELDAVCARRDSGKRDVEEMARVTSSLLQLLDMAPPDQIVVAATNFVEKVDTALLRRLPTAVAFELPGYGAREAMIARWWARVPHDAATLCIAVDATSGCSGAETRAIAMAAGRAAILEDSAILVDHVQMAVEAMRRKPKEHG